MSGSFSKGIAFSNAVLFPFQLNIPVKNAGLAGVCCCCQYSVPLNISNLVPYIVLLFKCFAIYFVNVGDCNRNGSDVMGTKAALEKEGLRTSYHKTIPDYPHQFFIASFQTSLSLAHITRCWMKQHQSVSRLTSILYLLAINIPDNRLCIRHIKIPFVKTPFV